MNDPWKPYIDAARAAGETEAWVPDYGDSGSAWQRVEVPYKPPVPWLLSNGHPVMDGAGGRLVYDCEPESGDGCLIPVPEPEAGQ